MSAPLELRYHSAMPGWCKVLGLKIRPVPECEGGGFCIAEDQAKAIVAAPDLLAALTNLSAEVLGCLPLMEAAARESIGNTNYALLIQRANEARALVTKATTP